MSTIDVVLTIAALACYLAAAVDFKVGVLAGLRFVALGLALQALAVLIP